MQISGTVFDKRKGAQALVIPCCKKKDGAFPACFSKEILPFIKTALETKDFKGDSEETLILYPQGGKEERVILLGLGKSESISVDSLRKAYASLIKVCISKKLSLINVLLPEKLEVSREDIVRGSLEGMLLGNYAFTELKHDSIKENPPLPVKEAFIVGLTSKDEKIVGKAKKIVGCVYEVRDLVNRNADDITPEVIAKYALSMSKKHPKIKTTVFDRKRIEKEKMGLLLAVSRASSVDPAFIISSYKGLPGSKEHIVLVGKGITYDTGGLNLKTSGMETMKADMAGSAAVLGCVQAAALLGLKRNVTAVVPSAENAIGSKAYKPGDVYRSYSGKTVEITNTDAEGRLVLADAVAYAKKELDPTCIIDMGTLTGGVLVALGEEIAGIMSNNSKLSEGLEKASKSSGEMIWPLPLHLDYKKLLKSDIADIKNSGVRLAHPIQPALFLHDFIGNIPWAHIDIAGPAFLSKPCGYHPMFGTGIGVRLLIEFLEQLPANLKF